jgi:hypothetical protein
LRFDNKQVKSSPQYQDIKRLVLECLDDCVDNVI